MYVQQEIRERWGGGPRQRGRCNGGGGRDKEYACGFAMGLKKILVAKTTQSNHDEKKTAPQIHRVWLNQAMKWTRSLIIIRRN